MELGRVGAADGRRGWRREDFLANGAAEVDGRAERGADCVRSLVAQLDDNRLLPRQRRRSETTRSQQQADEVAGARRTGFGHFLVAELGADRVGGRRHALQDLGHPGNKSVHERARRLSNYDHRLQPGRHDAGRRRLQHAETLSLDRRKSTLLMAANCRDIQFLHFAVEPQCHTLRR